MKRSVFMMATLFMAELSFGQVAKWLIPPVYDQVDMAKGADLVITQSADEKSIWDLDGQLLSKTKDELSPFVEGRSVTLGNDGRTVTGFFDDKGRFYPLNQCKRAYSNPLFSNGYLLVEKDDGFFAFADSSGHLKDGSYMNAYPFSNGYASCSTYKNMIKLKDSYHLLLDINLNEVAFSYNGKDFDSSDIDFISSVNDEKVGFVIIKRRVYYFNGTERIITPVFLTKDETNLKNQAKIEDDISVILLKNADKTYSLSAKCGKLGHVKIHFSNLLVPISIENADGKHEFKQKEIQPEYFTHPFQLSYNQDKWGLSVDNQEVLPPQFDKIIQCVGDVVLVKLSGKCGMLKVLKDEPFRLSLNKGNDIAFRHQKFETVLRVDIPKAISSQNTRIDMDSSFGCEVDLTSAEKKDTEYGNYVQYNCVLTIPPRLPDEMYGDNRNEIQYPAHILYDGLTSPLILFKVKGWHYKYFNVDINTAETTVSRGDLTFTFDINAERNPGETVYPTSINLLTDSLEYEQEKLSEIRYKCKVFGLREGMNNITIQIIEQGCPPASFPLEITYTKPSARTKKENVEIKKVKKSHDVAKPHIDI
jgi:hypothetical protein